MDKSILFRPQPLKLLLEIYRTKSGRQKPSIIDISKETGVSYSHTLTIMKILGDAEMLIFETEGRRKTLELTPKGMELAEQVNFINANLDLLNDLLFKDFTHTQ